MPMLINNRSTRKAILLKINNTPVCQHSLDKIDSTFVYFLAEQQQQQQGFEHQDPSAHGFAQNVQYQTIPQYGTSN